MTSAGRLPRRVRRSGGGRLLAALPHVLTGFRLFSAPLLWSLIADLHLSAALACLAAAVITDTVDGALARRFGVPSPSGAYFDVVADFAVVAAAFSAFAGIGVYPAWLVTLIVLVFVVFLFTSRLGRTIYDPVGRSIGGILFAAAAVTLLVPDLAVQQVVLWTVAGALGLTLAARIVFAAVWIVAAWNRGAAASRRALPPRGGG